MTGRPPRRLAGGAMGVHLDQRERLLIAASLGAVAAIATAIFCPPGGLRNPSMKSACGMKAVPRRIGCV